MQEMLSSKNQLENEYFKEYIITKYIIPENENIYIL